MPEERVVPSTLAGVPRTSWVRLAQRRIYFGHQSVGYNILAGVADVLRLEPVVQLQVIESTAPQPTVAAGLVHSQIGRNCDSKSKLDAFSSRLRAGTGPWANAALFKFCYADIEATTDIDSLMLDYEHTMEVLGQEFPALRLLHMTVPLTSPPNLLRRIAKRLLGRPASDYADNRQREAFNALLRARCAGAGTLFDLARIEATRPDGTLVDDGAAMFSGYTSDRSHLDETGRVVVAREFLRFLAGSAG